MPSSPPVDKATSPVKYYYDRRLVAAFGVWVSAMIVLGMAAAIVARTPNSPLRSSASYNVAAGALQFFLVFFTDTKPGSETDARPTKSSTYVLAASTIIWAAAFPVMFAFNSDDGRYQVLHLNKRIVLDLGMGIVGSLDNITLTCGAFGCSAFLCALCQWYYTYQLYSGNFTLPQIEEAFRDSK